MLSVAEISNRIQNPQLVIPEDLSTLQELSDKYPYTQLFSILYLKALSKAGDPRFEEELGKHSYRISDRVQLYELIESSPLSVDSKTIEAEIEVAEEYPVVEEVIIEEQKPVIEEEVVLSEDPITVEEKLDSELKEIQIEESPVTEQITVEEQETVIEEEVVLSENPVIVEEKLDSELEEIQIEESPVEEVTVDEQIIPQDKLEESILHHVFAANYKLDELTEEEQEKIESKEFASSETEIELSKPEEKQEVSETSFTGWLHSNNNYTERDTSDKAAIDAVVEDFSDFDPSSDLFGEVEKPKAEFFSPTKKAKKSLEENELPVSETLAKIYIMQGNYPQAISAYRQLSLSFPEKKIFFANLIEDLEKKINT